MILVVGATGDLGSQITHRLLQRGDQVRVLSRQGAVPPERWPRAETVRGDLKDPASLHDACDGVSTVVTTASATTRGAPDTIESVDLAGNLNLIEAAEAAGVQRFIFVSALGAAPEHPMPLLRAKGLSEQRLRASGMDWTILQPDVFMDRLMPIVVGLPALSNRPVTLIGQGTSRHSFVAVRDVVSYAVAVVQHPAAHRQTIRVGGPSPLSWDDVVQAFEHQLGRSVPVRRLAVGEPAEDLPDFVAQLLTALDGYDSPIDMTESNATYGIEPTDLSTFVRTFVSTNHHPVPG